MPPWKTSDLFAAFFGVLERAVAADHGLAEVADGGAKAGEDGGDEHALKAAECGLVEFDNVFKFHAFARVRLLATGESILGGLEIGN